MSRKASNEELDFSTTPLEPANFKLLRGDEVEQRRQWGDWDESGPWAKVLKRIKSSRRDPVIVIPGELGVLCG